jgi:hypothetical protein
MKADFYIGLGENARWLGSIGDGGHPAVVTREHDLFNLDGNIDDYTEDTFVAMVESILDDAPNHVLVARPSVGGTWPWDHNTSAGTAFAYAWNNGCIHVFEEGYMVAQHYPNGARRPSVFPSMIRKNPTHPAAGT